MKFQILSLLLLGAGFQRNHARIIDPSENDPLYTKWFLWEDKNGNIYNESLIEPWDTSNSSETPKLFKRPQFGIHNVQLYLYTVRNPIDHELIDPTNMTTLYTSEYFNPNHSNVFVIHGWKSDRSSLTNSIIKNAVVNTTTQGLNVFVVDWGAAAQQNYVTSKDALVDVGRGLGLYVQSIIDHYNLTSEAVSIVGHSFGAHLAGNVGAAMSTKPHYIIGLDPARPLFSLEDIDTRIDPSDAEYVQIVHTNGGLAAMASSIGHSDFFVNGGVFQPGCGVDLLDECAHLRAFDYYAESLYSCGFQAKLCKSYDEFKKGECSEKVSYLGCHQIDKSAFGDFFLNTNDKAPFAMNISGITPTSTKNRLL